jgi:hypothetical protein
MSEIVRPAPNSLVVRLPPHVFFVVSALFHYAMFANYVEKCQRFTLKFGGSDGRRGF